MVEIELNEIAHLVDATHLIIQQVENQKVISNSIYDFESETKKEIGELLSHNIFSDYEWTGNSSNWIHVPEINRDSDSNQYFQLGKITENQIILTEIPFEVNRYLWAFMDDQHLIFVNNGEMDSSFDFYLVTLE